MLIDAFRFKKISILMRVYIVQPLFIEVSFKILRKGPSLKVV